MADANDVVDAYGEEEHVPGAFNAEDPQDHYQNPPPTQPLPDPPVQRPAHSLVSMAESATPIGIANVRITHATHH